ncbi:MAG: YicC/YloC family endoribonuclease [Pseudomonadota bacterium]
MSNSLNSMTGFARCETPTPDGTLNWEIRSVNHRYLDAQFRMPEALRRFEHQLRKHATAQLARGKVDCTLTINRDTSGEMQLHINQDMLQAIAAASKTIRSGIEDAQAPNVIDVLRWPGVLAERERDDEALAKAVVYGFSRAITMLIEMRQNEGHHLGGLLLKRCDELDTLATSVRERRPSVLAACRARMLERLSRLDVTADPGRLETELALVAQKLDVDEELDRLDGHLDAMRTIVATGGPCGRKLDFLIQELNREANTLASKASDADTTSDAVDMKVAIEQMREQVQNIE